MANTHDYIISNDTGANVRADFNTLFLEIEHSNAGDSVPHLPAIPLNGAGKLWFDTTTDHLKYYTGTEWVSIARTARGAANITTITGSITPNGTTTLPGSGTKFTTQAKIGDQIVVSGETRTIMSITNDTTLIVDATVTGAGDSSPEIHPASFVVIDDSGGIDFLIDTNGKMEVTDGGSRTSLKGRTVAMAMVFGYS